MQRKFSRVNLRIKTIRRFETCLSKDEIVYMKNEEKWVEEIFE